MPDRINNENFQQGTEAPAFRTLAVNIPGIVYRVYLGERGRMTFFNGMLQQLTGYKADELTTGNICSIDPIIFSEDRSSVLQAVNDAIRNNLPFEVEYRIHHKNGSLRYFLEKGSPIYRCEGKPEFIDGIILDITARKRAEEEREQLIAKLDHEKRALVESQQRYRIMGEILPYGIWLTDAEGKAVYTSQSFLDLLDMSMEEMQGFGWTQKLVPEDVEPMMKKWMHSVHTGENWDSEHRIIDPDGEIRIVLTRGRPVRDASGKITAWAGINLDITERKAVEEALAQKHELLEGIYHHIPVLFVLWEPHLERFTFNRQAEEVLGYTTAEANACDFMRRVYPDDAYREKVLAFMQSLEPGWQEWVVTTRDGEEVPIEWANIKLSDDTRIGIGVDMRDQKEAEAQLRESHRELDEFTYALTHNVKAPFRAIQNYASFLLEDLADTLEGQPRQFLEGLEKAVALANRQFEDLEALYGLKDRPLNFEDLDIGQLLDEIAALHEGMPERELVTADRWPMLQGERFLLRQILMALVNNGFKFNQATVKQVEVFWQRPSDRRFEIVVRDNGIGIDSRYHDQILRLFQRLHTDSEYEGTGIGLAIVSRAVKRIGGELRIESAAGRGSTFVVSLPATVVGDSHKE